MDLDSLIVRVNLFIVVLLLARFAAKPIIDFVKGRKKATALELSRLEKEKERISGELEERMKIINEKKSCLANTEENIKNKGESIKAGIIKEAGIESELILEKAKQEAEKEIRQATEKLRSEVIDEIIKFD